MCQAIQLIKVVVPHGAGLEVSEQLVPNGVVKTATNIIGWWALLLNLFVFIDFVWYREIPNILMTLPTTFNSETN